MKSFLVSCFVSLFLASTASAIEPQKICGTITTQADEHGNRVFIVDKRIAPGFRNARIIPLSEEVMSALPDVGSTVDLCVNGHVYHHGTTHRIFSLIHAHSVE